MLRKLLALFRKTHSYPCSEWPVLEIETPPLDTGARKVGDLEIGDTLSKARPLGAPDSVEKISGDAINLIYARAGFQLEFSQQALSSAAYFVAEDRFQPNLASLRFSEPVIDSHKLTRTHDARRIEELFGPPESVDADNDETIVYYRINGLTVEFELGIQGTLKRVNVYPTEEG